MPTDEEKALYGLMILAEENTKLARKTLEALPEKLVGRLLPTLEKVSDDVAQAQAALSALPQVVQDAHRRIRSSAISGALVGASVCLTIGIFASMLFYFWQNTLLEKRTAIATELQIMREEIAKEQATLVKLQAKTWGITLKEDGNNRLIVLPSGTTFDREKTVTVANGKRKSLEAILLLNE